MNKFQCLLQIAGLTISDIINQRQLHYPDAKPFKRDVVARSPYLLPITDFRPDRTSKTLWAEAAQILLKKKYLNDAGFWAFSESERAGTVNQRYRKEECIHAPWLMQPRPQLSSRQREELKQQAMYARAVHRAYTSEDMRAARRYLLTGN